jgi:hypothetical protein
VGFNGKPCNLTEFRAARSPWRRIALDGAGFTHWIHKALGFAWSQWAPAAKGILPMSVSAIATSAPVMAPDTGAAKAPDVQSGNDADDATEALPPVVAALPPGQGTRIDQIV